MERFFSNRLSRYADHRNALENEATSWFSAYLHFGHLSCYEVFAHLI